MPSSQPSSDESRPLLHHPRDSSPASYRSVASSDTQASTTPEPPAFNKISSTDLAWVLAGLWSAVFLGALDGAFARGLPYAAFRALDSPARRRVRLMRQVRSWPPCCRPSGATSTSRTARRTSGRRTCCQCVALRLSMVRGTWRWPRVRFITTRWCRTAVGHPRAERRDASRALLLWYVVAGYEAKGPA